MKALSFYLAPLVVAGAVLAACDAAPEARAPATNPEVVVVKLFTTDDGCTVYRFRDGVGGYNQYFARCVGVESSSAMSRRNCGKGCSRASEIPTSYPGAKE